MGVIFNLLSDSDVAGIVNINLVLGLLAFGFIVKHFIKKLNNEFIPVILIICSIIVNFLNVEERTSGNFANAFMNSILSAAVAIGLHQSGKGSIKSLREFAINLLSKGAADTDDTDNNEEDEEEIDL